MELNIQMEKNCNLLGALFQQIIGELKSSSSVWEDFTAKATRLHMTLKSTVVAATNFLESFQHVADMATSTQGATRDIGSALTRLCMRHRSIESKLKVITSALLDLLVAPIQEKMEDWKKLVIQLDKDHNRESKKAQHDVKKAMSSAIRLQKKVKKGGKADAQKQLNESIQEVKQRLEILEEIERNAVRAALTEERGRYCLLVNCVKPFVDGEISMLGDVTHLQEIIDSLVKQSADPKTLPTASENVILDIGNSQVIWSCQESQLCQSPSHSMSSSKSSLSSLSSTGSSMSSSLSPRHQHQQQKSTVENIIHNENLIMEVTSARIRMMSSGCIPGSPPTIKAIRDKDILPDERPHTISSAYERNHARAALTSHTFEQPSGQHVCSMLTTPNLCHSSNWSLRSRPQSIVRDGEIPEICHCCMERSGAVICAVPEDVSDSNKIYAVPSAVNSKTKDDVDGTDESSDDTDRERKNFEIIQGFAKPGSTIADKCAEMLWPSGCQDPVLRHSESCNLNPRKSSFELELDDRLGVKRNGTTTEHIGNIIARRSSLYFQEKPSPPIRRVASFINAIAPLDDQDPRFSDMGIPRGVCEKHSQLDGTKTNPDSSNPCQSEELDSDDPKSIILRPPSPFRSPDLGDGLPEDLSTGIDCSSARIRPLPEKDCTYGQKPIFPLEGGRWMNLSSSRSMLSPDDVTPTNENQPIGFVSQTKSMIWIRAETKNQELLNKELNELELGSDILNGGRESTI